MSGTSSVPQIQFTPTGPLAPPENQILQGVRADLKASLGGRMRVTGASPGNQICTSESAEIGNKNDQLLYAMSQFDPATAMGKYQDALGRIYFLDRLPAEPTSVVCTLTGGGGPTAADVFIPAGTLAQDTHGNLYASTEDATIPGVGGSISVPFACTETGPIPLAAGQLNQIYQTIGGWDTISNPGDGAIGVLVESRQDYEYRRQQSVAKNALGILGAIKGNVLAVPDVLDAYVTDNSTGSPLTIGSVTLAANSLFVCVAGGDPMAIATAIWKKKMPGCGYTGTTVETVTDSNSGYALPYPTYPVRFTIAATQAIYVAVTITNSATVPSNALQQIRGAILAAFSGSDDGARARIGGTVYASRFYSPVISLGDWADVIEIQIGTAPSPTSNTVAVGIDTIPTMILANITLTLV